MDGRTMATGAGDRVGQYVLCREIGRGAMATVYEAEHMGLGKRVALKRMHPHLATDGTGASRFLREGRAATKIRSPHVVEVFDVGKHEDVPYLVMELLDGVDLAALLREQKKLAPAEVADLIIPVASAVHAAHQAGVVHRDLKPSNILLARRDGGDVTSPVSPIILDFGISKLLGDVDDLTASQVLLGTVHYMSPEQTRGGKKASAVSDQYALGVMLYECLTGAKPFAGSTPYALMHAIVSAKVSPPSALDPSLPAALDELVLRAMNRDPQARFPSVRALGAAMLPWASPEIRNRYARELGASGSVSAGGKPRGLMGRRAFVAFAVALAAAVGIGARSLRWHGPPAVPAPLSAPPPAALPSIVPAAVRLPAEPPASDPPLGEVPSAREIAPPPATARTPRRVVAPSERPERGTNGALIVE
jgi:eukaryotic-like serine/threonine-protein kinase